ncbi:GMC family oxidoreductase [Rhodobacteraceae bacterium]|nr:GMC family oxidoreductase [Paracoccaceae bacterium]
MARENKKKDVVIIGLGWTGSIMAMELCKEGLDVLALERGDDRNTVQDFKYPEVADELKYGIRYGFMQKPKKSTLTIRRTLEETALPYRHLGSFLPGDGVGGAGIHWNGHTWRPQEVEWRLKSYVEETFGAEIIPEGMQIQDWGVTAEEMEPHLDRFEYLLGVSGQAGNVNGNIIDGGNPFEAPRSKEYPLPPMTQNLDGDMFADAARKMGLHPFPRPAGIATAAYTNEYGMQLGPCNYCGFCERFGCLNYSKASPQTCVLDALKRKPNFEYKVNSEVLKIEKASDGQTATGVTYFDETTGEEVFQPADLVIVAAYSLHNVHLMLLSEIGQPYDPVSGEGVIGRNYAYQMNGGTSMFFKDHDFAPFIGTGSTGVSIDDYSIGQIDFGAEGFIGGSYITAGHSGGRPIQQLSVPPGTPSWGAEWKTAAKDWYAHKMSIGSHGSNMAYRDVCLDLDPTYTDTHGRPLMRMTFNWKDNDIRMTQFMKSKIEPIAESMNPDIMASSYKDSGAQYDVRPYQTTHNTGGVIMGTDPKTSALNRYLQSWDCHNVFVMGASAFPQNIQYNPTGTVGGLTYWAIDAIRKDYLPNPRPLV